MYGPAAWEGPTRRYGPVRRVAVISDVHANLAAMTAVAADIRAAGGADLLVSCGDLTWGAQPDETLALLDSEFGEHLLCIRGNGERAVTELSHGERPAERPRETWVPAQHSAHSLERVSAFPFSVVVTVTGLGPVRFCHGSPRSDHELITPGTPATRMADLSAGIEERILVTGHTHIQFDRRIADLRSVNPGSVGLPHHDGAPGTAYWAMLGPDVELRQTTYNVDEAAAVGARLGDPAAEVIERLLRVPPTPAEIIEEGEQLVFSD
ncbi:MAG TPA: metallophosphoesterase family protein [Actinocrinis sp.]